MSEEWRAAPGTKPGRGGDVPEPLGLVFHPPRVGFLPCSQQLVPREQLLDVFLAWDRRLSSRDGMLFTRRASHMKHSCEDALPSHPGRSLLDTPELLWNGCKQQEPWRNLVGRCCCRQEHPGAARGGGGSCLRWQPSLGSVNGFAGGLRGSDAFLWLGRGWWPRCQPILGWTQLGKQPGPQPCWPSSVPSAITVPDAAGAWGAWAPRTEKKGKKKTNWGGEIPKLGGKTQNWGRGEPQMQGKKPNWGKKDPELGGGNPKLVGETPNAGKKLQTRGKKTQTRGKKHQMLEKNPKLWKNSLTGGRKKKNPNPSNEIAPTAARTRQLSWRTLPCVSGNELAWFGASGLATGRRTRSPWRLPSHCQKKIKNIFLLLGGDFRSRGCSAAARAIRKGFRAPTAPGSHAVLGSAPPASATSQKGDFLF